MEERDGREQEVGPVHGIGCMIVEKKNGGEGKKDEWASGKGVFLVSRVEKMETELMGSLVGLPGRKKMMGE